MSNTESGNENNFAETSLPVHTRRDVERAIDEDRYSARMERIFELSDVVSVYSPNGKEQWYRVASTKVTPDDYQLMLENRPEQLGMIIRDENLQSWRDSLKKGDTPE